MKNQCSKCGAKIYFVLTKKGNSMPVDISSLTEEDKKAILFSKLGERYPVAFRPGVHVSHFATCPNADDFRKKKDDTTDKS